MSKRKPPTTWAELKQKVSNRRQGISDARTEKKVDYITVQRLSAGVEGKCQKYSRIGALTMVKMSGQDLTLSNIKKACKEHFKIPHWMQCDILAGERGPSYDSLEQIKNFNLLHVRFIESKDELEDHGLLIPAFPPRRRSFAIDCEDDSILNLSILGSARREEERKGNTVSSAKVDEERKETQCVASISLSEMLKLGQVIAPNKRIDILNIQLEEFSADSLTWCAPTEVRLSVDKQPFASGASRNAFHATAISGLPHGRYVLKRQREDRLLDIQDLFESEEVHTRKSVQMQTLARNLASSLKKQALGLKEYGKTFSFTKVYFGKYGDEVVTIESHINGDFCKYINNNGNIILQDCSEIALKAETFAHYTYEKSEKKLIVLDVQGVGFTLTDPEIASAELRDSKNNILFCSGNLSILAIQTFLSMHTCNHYCSLLGLSKVQE